MSLLQSKIRAPEPSPRMIRRPRLEHKVRSEPWRIVVFQAPAGFGKSVLASQLHEQREHPSAWLFLEPQDQPIQRFCRYLAGALAQALPQIERTELLTSIDASTFDAHAWVEDLAFFFEEFTPPQVTLTLDNFESVAGSRDIADLLFRLSELCHEFLQLLITTRQETGLPVSRMAERRQCLVFTSRDLAFNLEEFHSAAARRESPPPPDSLEDLWERSEGWCVYLGLGSSSRDPVAEPGSYLGETILGGLSEPTKELLRSIALLDTVSSDSLRALDLNTTLKALGQELSAAGVPHSVVGPGVIRLHPLVRDVFREEYKGSARNHEPVIRRAIDYYLELDSPDAALQCLLDIEHHELALTVLSEQWGAIFKHLTISEAESLLDQFSEESKRDMRHISAQLSLLEVRGESRRTADLVSSLRKEGRLSQDSPQSVQLWVQEARARALLGELDYDGLRREWNAHAHRASLETRVDGEFLLVMAALYELRMKRAQEHISSVLSFEQELTPVSLARALNSQGVVLHETGKAQEALEFFERGVEHCKIHGELAYRSLMHLGQAFSCKDLGRLDEAQAALTQCLECEDAHSPRVVVLSHWHRTRGEILWYQGRRMEAYQELTKAHELFQTHNQFEALATGVFLDHWFPEKSRRPRVTLEDFGDASSRSEAKTRFLIHLGRMAFRERDAEQGVALCAQAREMSREMPAWQATAWLTEAWGLAFKGAGEAALEKGLAILNQLDRPAYPMADPELTAWLVATSVKSEIHAPVAFRLVAGEMSVNLTPAFQGALEGASEPERLRLITASIQLGVRGLEEDLEELPDLPPELVEQYNQVIADLPLPPLAITTFGRFSAISPAGEIHFGRSASRKIFQALLVEHPSRLHEDKLIDWFWPDQDPSKAKRTIQTAVNELRKNLDAHHRPRGVSYIAYEQQQYQLVLPDRSRVDLHRFQTLAQKRQHSAEDLRVLVDLYQGDLFPDDPYNEFLAEARERSRLSMLEAVGELARRTGPGAESQRYLSKALAFDPLWAEGIDLMVRYLAQNGRVLAAIRTYRDYEARLEREVGVRPDPPLQELYRQLTRA